MHFQSYFNTTIKIIGLYDGSIPLTYFLKQYFSQHKKHGSKDRKIISHTCYNFYRLGKSFTDISLEEKLKIAIFVCNDAIDEWEFLYEQDWLNHHNKFLRERIAFTQTKYQLSLNDVFPFADELSDDVNASAFTESFFIQPDVFIRVRPGYKNDVTQKLKFHQRNFTNVDEDCIALSPSTNIELIIDLDKEAVIQDYSSQQIKRTLNIVKEATNQQQEIDIWDCCAGSGGKSILSYDVLGKINLDVSDVRASIIQNLKQRFNKAGIKNYKSLVADISNTKPKNEHKKFDLIICDAPCTGSGTWSRTPEQLYFFQAKKIDDYVLLQQKIIRNTVHALKQNGYFLYITCSIFKKENERNVKFIQQHFKLKLLETKLLKGYDKKADTMFAALLQKNN